PESAEGGPLARVEDGDLVRLDVDAGTLDLLVDPAVLAARVPATLDMRRNAKGTGRELFGVLRRAVSGAEEGATVFAPDFASV
ncbi:MAG TPA: dihydroxy-acid dehydratase, partial [Stellaceae bacterium]|nr:dihydroxy-acid dehydratase [Stellaceae bacterium]